MPEFGQHALEVLRQPLEDKVVTISRAQGSLTFPANFMLVGAHESVSVRLLRRPRARVHLQPERGQPVPEAPLRPAARPHRHPRRGAARARSRSCRTSAAASRRPRSGRGSRRRGRGRRRGSRKAARSRAAAARRSRPPALTCNADMGPTQVRDHCQVDETARQLLAAAMRQMNLSARAYHRILKLARTIADLAGSGADPARAHRGGDPVSAAAAGVTRRRHRLRGTQLQAPLAVKDNANLVPMRLALLLQSLSRARVKISRFVLDKVSLCDSISDCCPSTKGQ